MFSFLSDAFNVALYKPLFNFLVLLYNYLPGHDFGLAIIFLTIIIRAILYPVSVKAFKSQKALQSLQPKLKEIQEKHKNDKEKQAKETLELYRKEKINPFSGLFLAFIQLPILIALYKVFWQGLKPEELGNLYSFVFNPSHINAVSFGLVDLSKPNIILAILAGILQFFQTKMSLPKESKNSKTENPMAFIMQKQMLYFFPILTIIILFNLPSALGLYWVASGIFTIIQQYFILRNNKE
jgi:YidC/Oxa1 family membrane protein insertase